MEINDIQSEALTTLSLSATPLTARLVFERSALAEEPRQVANALRRLKSEGLAEQATVDVRGYVLTAAGRARLGKRQAGELGTADKPAAGHPWRQESAPAKGARSNLLGTAPDRILGDGSGQPLPPVEGGAVQPEREAGPESPGPESPTAEQMDRAVAQLDAELAAERAAQARFGFWSDGTLEIATQSGTVRLPPAETRRLLDWMVSIRPAVHRPLGYGDVARVTS